MSIKFGKVISLYGGAGLVFFGVLMRDYLICVVYPSDFTVIYESFYISNVITLMPTNVLLFAKIEKNKIKKIALLISIISCVIGVFIEPKIVLYSAVFVILTLSSSLLGNLMLGMGHFFIFRSRDFFLYVFMIILMKTFLIDWFIVVLVLQIILMVIIIYLSNNKHNELGANNLKMLTFNKSFVVALPSIFFQLSLFCFSYFKIFEGYEYLMRVSMYINSLLLVGAPVLASYSNINLKKIQKSLIIILSTIIVIITICFIFEITDLFLILMSIGCAGLTYLFVCAGMLSTEK